MNDFFRGAAYLFNGFSLIFKPGLRRFVFIPLVINICFFIGLFFLARHYMQVFNEWFATFLPHWLFWLEWILWVLFVVSFFIVFLYAFIIVANLIAAPFNSFLAEKVELYLTNQPLPNRGWFENVKDIPRTIGRQFAILGYYLPRAIALLILFFVPVIQLIAAPIWFLFNAWFLSLTYIDYPTDLHRIPVRDVRAWLSERRGLALGFGVGALVMSLIPFLNFFVIPAAVAGATLCWVQESHRDLLIKSKH